MKEVCEVWNVSLYCDLTTDNNLLQLAAEVPMSHTLQTTSEVCLLSVVINVRICILVKVSSKKCAQ
jgi:hypothetical protein